jgi:cell shape-determining protein MreC
MRRSTVRTRRLFPAALLLTLLLALLPHRWLGWLSQVADLVSLPILPLSDAAGWVARTVWPPRELAAEEARSLEHLAEELAQWERRARAAELRASELEAELAAIQQLPLDRTAGPLRIIRASVTGRNVLRPEGAVEVNRGAQHGVRQGAIAVHGGGHLLGRVVGAEGLRSILMPVTSPGIGVLRARVAPGKPGDVPADQMPVVQLAALGDGTLSGDAPQDRQIAPGDRVLLFDHAWPDAAQAMVLGKIESITPKDEQPLRDRLVVRPIYPLEGLARLTLVVEEPEGEEVPP